MIISHAKKFIFFHIGKTGGTTVERRLADYHDDAPGFLSFDPDSYGIHSHVGLSYFCESAKRYELLRNYYTFCFVRNPYDFLYSVFCQWVKTGLLSAGNFSEWVTELDFVNAFNTLSLPHVDARAKLRDGYMHLYTHKGDTCLMNFIGKVEFFEHDFEIVCDALGLTYDVRIHENILTPPRRFSPQQISVTSKTCYKYLHKYNQKAAALVNCFFEKDFQWFGYPVFDPGDFDAIVPPELY